MWVWIVAGAMVVVALAMEGRRSARRAPQQIMVQQVAPTRRVTIQRTGKGVKMIGCLGGIVTLAGLFTLNAPLFLVGLGIEVVTAVVGWWRYD